MHYLGDPRWQLLILPTGSLLVSMVIAEVDGAGLWRPIEWELPMEKGRESRELLRSDMGNKNGKGSLPILAQVIVVPLHAFGLHFQERSHLRVPHHFGLAVIDGPDRAADAALGDPFPETVGMKFRVHLLMVATYRAFHEILSL
jgi:hypothetical protein